MIKKRQISVPVPAKQEDDLMKDLRNTIGLEDLYIDKLAFSLAYS